MEAYRERPGGRLRQPSVRRVAVVLAVVTLLAAVITFAGVSLAGTDVPTGPDPDTMRWPALAEAARIPDDQGPSPECTPKPGPTDATTAPPVTQPPATPAPAVTQPTADRPNLCHADEGGPVSGDYLDIRGVAPNVRNPRLGRDASLGTFVSVCGRNEEGHANSGNFIVAPGVTNGAHQTHDYVGNLSTDGNSTKDSLAAAGTTCAGDDRSAYFWPVLRQRGTVAGDADADGGGKDRNVGTAIRPASVRVEFRGNAKSKVVAMPRFLLVITGDAKALTNGPASARAQWTCTGFTNRLTTKYPLCPPGSQVQRIVNFPSCWDGVNTDSPNHRSHIVFPEAGGVCPEGTRAVPQLRLTLTYSVPTGRSYSVDSFPEQLHSPLTDHADFANLMPDSLMSTAVDCINRGRRC